MTDDQEAQDKNMTVAAIPPMGWNSWDTYGASVTEAEILANAEVLAGELLPFGWDTLVVDIQWYEPDAHSSAYRPFVPLTVDGHSRLVPAANRFPSAADGRGFAPLAERIHAMGLKFGIHIMRGVPRQAVHAATPILGSDVTARDIAQTNSICPWNTDMYGVDATRSGAQEYYDSLFALYASWGVDFVKADDMLLPYHRGEINLMRNALDACGREMVLSLSCGPTPVAEAGHLSSRAHMWRTTADFWDRWSDLRAAFDICAAWAPYAGPGHWPDADMLPLGRIALRSGETGVRDRYTRFTRPEQTTLMTLWCVARSPLMLGTDLTRLDDETRDLLTNPEVLAVLRDGDGAREVYREHDVIVWTSRLDESSTALAVFNVGKDDRDVQLDLRAVGIDGEVTLRDLWSRSDQGKASGTTGMHVEAHGARLFRVQHLG
ncbi:glycoside hydrolase family 27 protein [Micromonospora sp. WMMA2032]|uniref:glycoside hydrolase family 27 protein n=1 Tax=Micromonospora sp. WMMA2032 TaxID=2039870 RepID=UPI0020A29630|nr:glycoside hydrolase family 27 protein [Micromonospora sp. WMMA2032]